MSQVSVDIKKAKMKAQGWKRYLSVFRNLIVGKEADKGLIFKIFIYVVLFDVAFIYMYPIFYMIANMIKDTKDLLDPSVIWVPHAIFLGTLKEAWTQLHYLSAFSISMMYSGLTAVLQTISCAVAGYAFARLQFPFKKFWFFCLLLTFVVPPQVLVLPMILGAHKLHILNTYIPLIVPSAFGHGLKGALFVIIYRQFFSTQPKELEEAAIMDGASVFRVFFRVMLPMARPAIVVIFLFSFVWSWNDSYFPSIFLVQSSHQPLSLGISQISAYLAQKEAQTGPSIFDTPIKMATSFLMILPPLVLYTFTQRWFVEGVERTGLVE